MQLNCTLFTESFCESLGRVLPLANIEIARGDKRIAIIRAK